MTLKTGFAAMLLTAAVWGQSPPAPAAPAFDVASVKPLIPPYPTGGGPWTVTHGRFKADMGWIRAIIAWAYDLLPTQAKGGPDWIDSELYDFDARSLNEDVAPPQVRLMLQTLLTDRFKLAAHRETQQGQVYTLAIGKNGSKMTESKEGRKNYLNWTGIGQVECTECNMLALIGVLSSTLGNPVLDQTGLKGQYSFKLEFTDPRVLTPQNNAAGDSRPTLAAALEDQLGLKLESKKGPVEVLVVDHIERPTAN